MGMQRARNTIGAACGLVGPAAFTAAWLLATRRQPAYSIANEHISGLAAPDAASPQVMTAGFLALGTCTVGFAAALEERLRSGGRAAGGGPALLAASGVALLSAGLFRRDRMSNYPMPGEPPTRQSWRNDLHDLSAVAAAAYGIAALTALAARLRHDPAFGDLAAPAGLAALAAGGLSAWFATDVVRPGNGIVQRASISIPLAVMVRLAVRMLADGDGREGRP
ncbi:MAG: DUF998 domain-containing protein [Planctomycetaceae bacterium]